MGQPGEERELERGPLRLAQLRQGGADAVASDVAPGLVVDVVGRDLALRVDLGRRSACGWLASRRTRSMALWRARLNSHGPTDPAAGSNRSASPERDEDLLDDLLGEPVRPGHLVGEGVAADRCSGRTGPRPRRSSRSTIRAKQAGILGASGARAVDVGSGSGTGTSLSPSRQRRGGEPVRGEEHSLAVAWRRPCDRDPRSREPQSMPIRGERGRRMGPEPPAGSIAGRCSPPCSASLPRPPLPADAAADGVSSRRSSSCRQSRGLEPLTAAGHPTRTTGRRRTHGAGALVKDASTGRSASDRPVEAGASSLDRCWTGCTWIEVDEPLGALARGDARSARGSRDAHAALTAASAACTCRSP